MESLQQSPRLNRNQIRGFWAAWGGWALDGMDSFIYALVLVPTLRDLLPRSGIPDTTANVGYYGGLLFALFLIGWGCSIIWGPVADRFGRVPALVLAILCYSLFTLLSALATNVWTLAIFRLLAGVGIGGEWSIGGVFVAEEWPEERRKMGAGLMHTGYYFGFFLAAIANDLVGSRYGWRAMFLLGGAPAILSAFIYSGVRESGRWEKRYGQLSQKWTAQRAFFSLFSPEYRRRTMLNSTFLFISIIGLWGGSVYVPEAVIYLASKEGRTAVEGAHLASYSTMLLAGGTILGCLILPVLAEWLGRRVTLGLFFLLMLIFIWIAFGRVFYFQRGALSWFMACLFFLGVGGANFAMYTLWLPEQYRTECRASAFAFVTSIGRFLGAGVTFLVGAGVRHFHTIGTPVAFTASAFLVGLLLLPFGQETKGKLLPA